MNIMHFYNNHKIKLNPNFLKLNMGLKSQLTYSTYLDYIVL
jgi:hypothetical protein